MKDLKEKLKGTCVLNESVEFKEGEETDQGVLIHKHQGKAWVIKEGQSFGCLVPLSSLRKIDPDADLKKIADEIRDEELGHSKGLYTWSQLAQMQTMLIEAMKRVKK